MPLSFQELVQVATGTIQLAFALFQISVKLGCGPSCGAFRGRDSSGENSGEIQEEKMNLQVPQPSFPGKGSPQVRNQPRLFEFLFWEERNPAVRSLLSVRDAPQLRLQGSCGSEAPIGQLYCSYGRKQQLGILLHIWLEQLCFCHDLSESNCFFGHEDIE